MYTLVAVSLGHLRQLISFSHLTQLFSMYFLIELQLEFTLKYMTKLSYVISLGHVMS